MRIAQGAITLDGPLTMRTVAALLQPGRDAIAAGARAIDLAAVTDVDSAAVALLLDWTRTAGSPLELRSPGGALSSLVQLYGVGELLRAEAR